jgi:NAD(P)-dependent dehydrogenase (short-subunit alcohol dehydrogenase family)
MSGARGRSRSVLVVRADSPVGRAAVARFDAAGDRTHAVAGELADARAHAVSVDAAIEVLGRIDVLVIPGSPAVSPSSRPEGARVAIDAGLRTPFFWAQAAARSMSGGRLVLVAPARADAAGVPAPATVVEGGLLALVRLLAVELAPRGFHVNAVCPVAADANPVVAAAAIEFLASDDASYMTGSSLPVLASETPRLASPLDWAAHAEPRE